KALSFLKIVKISHVSIWNWLQKYRPWKYFKERKIKEYVIDETGIRSGSQLLWFWIVIEPIDKEILSFHISKIRNTFVAERILSEVVDMYRKHHVSSDGGTWYPQDCKFLDLYHHLHSSFEKSIMERIVHYKR
ncbi:MAG TPA: hypothetical protein VIY08_00400, partial [Candidatus Nitrosocosmicus sp.]